MSLAFVQDYARRLLELVGRFLSFRACASMYGVRASEVERSASELASALTSIGVRADVRRFSQVHVCDARAEAEFLKSVSAVIRTAELLKRELALLQETSRRFGISTVVESVDDIVVEVRRAKQNA